ncbi:sigma-70 family RNA polymerase sigma factor [Streptomyces sp. NPDC006326]|uniref:sigma-70 family RNA polymerase sigma factor n=1 Tax=Streptomyces sp. NPDC006326 TaxID=3156752 RepID=UPI00339F942A
MSVDGREEPSGGVGGEIGADTPQARQVPAQREPGGRHAARRPSGGGELPPSDGDLIARLRAGDDGAYEELFRRHAAAVRRYARTCCRDGHTADDLTAEVFARTLQAVRGGAGPDQSVRAYLLTTVRRVAAAWAKTARREQLVEDFAVFAEQAAVGSEGGGLSGLAGLSGDDTLGLGADVRAMREAEQSLALQAFRSLPERWQAVLWHTTVEESSPSAIAPLFGLSANATAVLASRAREGLKQAYLQAHVSAALSAGGDCARFADRLGAYARGGLRMRAERGLRGHLEECAKCRLAAGELKDVNAGIPALLPVAVIGWFAAGYAAKAAGVVAGGAVAAGGAGAAAAASGGSAAGAGAAGAGAAGASGAGSASAGAVGAGGAAGAGGSGGAGVGGAVVSEGLGLPAKAALAAGIAVAAAAGVVFALVGDDAEPGVPAQPPPGVAAPARPAPVTPPAPEPVEVQGPVATAAASPPASPAPSASKPRPAAVPSRAPKASPTPSPSPTPPATPGPRPEPARPSPVPSPPKPSQGFALAGLGHSAFGDHAGPELRTWHSSWVWQRRGVWIGEQRFGQGITVSSRSSVEIDLNRQCTAFSARAGVDGLSLPTDGTVRFSVYGDGQRLWQSAALGSADRAAAVHVSLAGRTTLRLVVERAGQGSLPTLASWADGVISCR